MISVATKPLRKKRGGKGVNYFYSETFEKGTLWDQYKFKWILPCIEVVLLRFQSHNIDRGIKFGDLVLSIVERYTIHCPFIGGSTSRGSAVQVNFVKVMFVKAWPIILFSDSHPQPL